MYGRTTNNAGAAQYIPQYSQYPTAGAPMMNPRSPAPNANPYRPPYSSGSPYQNGIASPSAAAPGKGTARPQQVSPKRSTSQPTTPPQQARYPTPYPGYTNGPVGYKPAGSNGYAPAPQQQQPTPWPPATGQRDVTTPSLASSTGDSDSNSSNASQQTMSYPPSTMTNGPTTGGYGQMPSTPYNPATMNESSNNNNHMNASGHPYVDQQYGNIPLPNYGYPPQQQMNPYGNHPPGMHGPSTNDFRPPPVQTMDDESNAYRNRPPSGMMMDPQQQQAHHPPALSQSHSVSSSTNGPKSPSGTSMSSYVPDDADSSNSSFADSPPPSHEKGNSKRKLSSTTSNTHGTPAEVFTKLREMGDDAERQERHVFVDRLQKLWEEHQIVCRNLPSISKQTIDLYRLYTCVREQSGFQEFSKVAKNRHWRDIASKLNIPNSSSAAFNVKQKYINLKLFHYECKFDRGGVNPEPILAEIEKQQGKRAKTPKKGANTSGVTTNANSNDGSNDGKSNASLPPPSNAQPPNSIQQPPPPPPPPSQQPMPDPYRGYPPHPMGHPQQAYRSMPMSMHPYGSTGNEMQPPYDPSTGGQMMYTNPEMDYQRAGYPPSTWISTAAATTSNDDETAGQWLWNATATVSSSTTARTDGSTASTARPLSINRFETSAAAANGSSVTGRLQWSTGSTTQSTSSTSPIWSSTDISLSCSTTDAKCLSSLRCLSTPTPATTNSDDARRSSTSATRSLPIATGAPESNLCELVAGQLSLQESRECQRRCVQCRQSRSSQRK